MRPASRILALFAVAGVLTIASSSYAQWPRAGFANGSGSGGLVPNGTSGVIIGGNFTYDLDSTGAQLWKTTGGSTSASDGAGGALGISGGAFLTANHYAGGALVWSTQFRNLSSGIQNTMSCSDGAGGIIAVWGDIRSGNYDPYVQRVNAAGVVQWTTNGVALCTQPNAQDFPVIAPDGSGGVIVAWADPRPGAVGGFDIYAQRVNAAGAVQWATDGIVVCDAAGQQISPAIASDGAGGAIIAWWDARSGDRDVYAQRINGAGVAQWAANGLDVAGGAFDQLLPMLIPDGSNGAFMTWEDHRAGGNDGLDIYAQHLNGAGAPLWTPTGVAVCTNPLRQMRPNLVPDGFGGIVIAWVDTRITDGSSFGVFAQRLDASGARQWTADGVVGTERFGTVNTLIAMAPDFAGGAYFLNNGLYRLLASGLRSWVPDYTAKITSVPDVAADEGSAVHVDMVPPLHDGGPLASTSPGEMVTAYNVWRRVGGASAVASSAVDVGAARTLVANGLHRHVTIDAAQAAPVGFPPGSWESLGNHSATQSATYRFVAATRADSSAAGPATEAFVVTAHTTDPTFFTVSAAASGHSVDNLAPAFPLNLVGGQSGPTRVRLAWSPGLEHDLAGYAVYGGTSAGFTPSAANRIAQPTASTFEDPAFVPGVSYYKVSAIDRHGNESGFALLTPSQVTSVPPGVVPSVSFLGTPSPNPTSTTTSIEWGLARDGRVSLAIFDLGGRRVSTLIEGSVTAGVRRVAWDGRDDAHHPAPAGVYLVRCVGPGISSSRKIIRTD